MLDNMVDEIARKDFIFKIGEPRISTDLNTPDSVTM